MATKTALRRVPKQERGQRRIERVLEAAALEFARVGFEAATTNTIARRAKTSVGSLYQFFPNKEAILEALTARYLEQMRAMHAVTLGPAAAELPLADFYDRLVDTLAEFQATHPGFLALFYGSTTSPQLQAAAGRLLQECIQNAEAAIGARIPNLTPHRRRLYATINVTAMKALLPLAVQAAPAARAEMLAEIKKLMVRYMEAEQAALIGAGDPCGSGVQRGPRDGVA